MKITFNEVFNEVSLKCVVFCYKLQNNEKQKFLGVWIRKGPHSFYFKKLHEGLHEGESSILRTFMSKLNIDT